jgi:4-hydroxy-2-oxoheptanedioate aldolase
MFTNNCLTRIRNGEKALGLAMSDPSEELVELAGRVGLDFVAFDGQHSPITPERVGRLCRVAIGFGVTPIMRVPDGRESTILSYLDRGIRQITVPNLQTREEAEALVKYSFFAPLGLRSATSLSMVFHQDTASRADLMADVNANLVVVPQIESATCVDNLEDILQVDGLQYFAEGREDMAQSLGIPGGHADPRVDEAYARARAKLKAAGKEMWIDHLESIDVVQLVRGGAEDLLRKHNREPRMAW